VVTEENDSKNGEDDQEEQGDSESDSQKHTEDIDNSDVLAYSGQISGQEDNE